MDLFTRCARCETVFKVTSGDLQASGGQVRCGRCQAVFDAFASLTARPPGQSRTDAPTSPDLSTRSQEGSKASPDKQRSPEFAATGPEPPETPPPTVLSDEPAPAELSSNQMIQNQPTAVAQSTESRHEVAESASRAALVGPQRGPAAAPSRATDRNANDPAMNLFEWEFKAAPKFPRTRFWLGLSLILGVVAIVQAAYVFRTQLMVNFPQFRPAYEQVCLLISCDIGLARLTDQLDIDASDLQVINPQKRNEVELTALVRNRARVAVEYPAFELTLTNEKEQTVARRVFLPDEYLSEATAKEQGFPGRGELAVRLFLDIGPLRAAGYRIYLFYPT